MVAAPRESLTRPSVSSKNQGLAITVAERVQLRVQAPTANPEEGFP